MIEFGLLTLAQDDARPLTPGAASNGGGNGGSAVELQPAGPDAVDGGGAPDGGQPGLGGFWILGVMILFFWILVFLPQRREKKKHQGMLEQLKKGDKVQTIGGVLGTVVDVRDQFITLKVDESNNTRVRFARSAIQSRSDGDSDKA